MLAKGAKATFPAARLGFQASKPFLRRRARQRFEHLAETARTVGEVLAVYGPQAAYELGLAEPPRPKRTTPRVALDMLIGASAVYFLEPDAGPQHRQKLGELVS